MPVEFHVPHPPFGFKPEHAEDEMWIRDPESWTARLHESGHGFEVRPMNHLDNPEGKRFPGDWPADLTLGCPTSGLQGYSTLQETFGFNVLNAAGFINRLPEQGPGWSGQTTALPGRYARIRDPTMRRGDVHPILRRDMWYYINDEDYENILPALSLASAMLDDPETLYYYHALSKPIDEMQLVVDPTLGECRVTELPTRLSDAELEAVSQKIVGLRHYTSWNVPENRNDTTGVYGLVTPLLAGIFDDEQLASQPNTYQTKILITREYIDIVRAWKSKPETFEEFYYTQVERAKVDPPCRLKHWDSEAAILRTMQFLATTMLHELSHAFVAAYFPRIFTQTQPNAPQEPWLAGLRVNEQGYAGDLLHWGGLIRAPALPTVVPENDMWRKFCMLSGAFGAHYVREYAVGEDNTLLVPYRIMGPPDPRRTQLITPVPQRWFDWLWSDELWEEEIMRLGKDAMKLPDLEEWSLVEDVDGLGSW